MLSETWQTNLPTAKIRKRRVAPRQDAILEFLKDYKADPQNEGNNPTYDEVARALGVSVPTVYNAAMRMVAHGVLRLNKNNKLLLGGKYIPPDESEMSTA